MVYEKDVPIGESIVSLDILDTAGNVSSWPLSLWSCDWIPWLHFKNVFSSSANKKNKQGILPTKGLYR